jgi:hypothetical protein
MIVVQARPQENGETLSEKLTKAKMSRGMAQVVKYKAMSSNPRNEKKNKNNNIHKQVHFKEFR